MPKKSAIVRFFPDLKIYMGFNSFCRSSFNEKKGTFPYFHNEKRLIGLVKKFNFLKDWNR